MFTIQNIQGLNDLEMSVYQYVMPWWDIRHGAVLMLFLSLRGNCVNGTDLSM